MAISVKWGILKKKDRNKKRRPHRAVLCYAVLSLLLLLLLLLRDCSRSKIFLTRARRKTAPRLRRGKRKPSGRVIPDDRMTPKKRPNRTAWRVGISMCVASAMCFCVCALSAAWAWRGMGETDSRKIGDGKEPKAGGIIVLHARLPQDLLAVGVEPEVPQADRRHETLRPLELPLAAKERLNELDSGALA